MSWTSDLLEPRKGRSPRRRRNFDDPLDRAIADEAGPLNSVDTPLPLAAPVGPGAANRSPDVAKVNTLLAAAGHLDPSSADGGSKRFGKSSENAVRRFQKNAGLNIDGLIFPDGPTIDALSRPKRELPGFTEPARALRRAIRRSPGTNAAENDRTVEALTKTTDPGPLPLYMAEAWNAGMDGKVDVADLLARLVARAPKAATTLLSRLVPMVPAAERGLLQGAATLRRLPDEDEDDDDDEDEDEPGPGDDDPKPKPPASPPDDDKDPDEPDPDPEPDDPKPPEDDEDKPKPKPDKKRECADLAKQLRDARIYRDGWNKLAFTESEKLRKKESEMDTKMGEIEAVAVELSIRIAVSAATLPIVAARASQMTDNVLKAMALQDLIREWYALESGAETTARTIKDAIEKVGEYNQVISRVSARIQELGCDTG